MFSVSYPWLPYAVGYAVACGGSQLIVGAAVRKLWSIAEKDIKKKKISFTAPIHAPRTVSFWHGVVETAIYTTSVAFGKPEGIAVWLGFKAVMRWRISDKEDPRHVPGSLIYMIGTAMNVGFGIIGGLIARGWFLS
jgi:hypothetical protein